MALAGELRNELKKLYPEDHYFVTNQRLSNVPKDYNHIPGSMIHQSMKTLSQLVIDAQARPPVVQLDFIRPQSTEEMGQYQRLEWPSQLLHHLVIRTGKETASLAATRWVTDDIAKTNLDARKTRRRLEIIKQARDCGLDMPKDVLDVAMQSLDLGTNVHKFNDFETSSDEEGLVSDSNDEDGNDDAPSNDTDLGFVDLTTGIPTPRAQTPTSPIPPPPPAPTTPGTSTPRPSVILPTVEEFERVKHLIPRPTTTAPTPSVPTPSARPSAAPSFAPTMEEFQQVFQMIPQLVQNEVNRSLNAIRPQTEPSPSTRSLSPLGRYNIGSGRGPSPVNIVINTTDAGKIKPKTFACY